MTSRPGRSLPLYQLNDLFIVHPIFYPYFLAFLNYIHVLEEWMQLLKSLTFDNFPRIWNAFFHQEKLLSFSMLESQDSFFVQGFFSFSSFNDMHKDNL